MKGSLRVINLIMAIIWETNSFKQPCDLKRNMNMEKDVNRKWHTFWSEEGGAKLLMGRYSLNVDLNYLYIKLQTMLKFFSPYFQYMI